MQEWSVNVTIQVSGTRDLIADGAEAYLDVLLDAPELIGPVTSANLAEGSIGALFQIAAPDYPTAMQIAMRIIPGSLLQAFGAEAFASVSGVGVARDPEHAMTQSPVFAYA